MNVSNGFMILAVRKFEWTELAVKLNQYLLFGKERGLHPKGIVGGIIRG